MGVFTQLIGDATARSCDIMPRYFFCPVAEHGSATDLVGDECRDLAEVRQRAKDTAAEIAHAQLMAGKHPRGWVEVWDEDQRPVFMLPLRAVAS
jgi:hypothetical protein